MQLRAGAHLDNAVWDSLLFAEGREPEHQLDGVNIVCNAHQLCLPALHELRDVVQAILDHNWLLLLRSLKTRCALVWMCEQSA